MDNIGNADFVFKVVLGLCTFCLSLYVFVSNRNRVKAQELQDLDRRLTVAEERIRYLPDLEDMEALRGDLKEIRAQVASLKDMITPLAHGLDRINSWLLTNK